MTIVLCPTKKEIFFDNTQKNENFHIIPVTRKHTLKKKISEISKLVLEATLQDKRISWRTGLSLAGQ